MLAHSLCFSGGTKAAVSCVACDAAGSRMWTGSLDCSLRVWDFHAFGRQQDLLPRRLIAGESRLLELHYSPLAGGRLLAIYDSPAARLLSREGSVVAECCRGDMYLADQLKTSGHVSSLTSGDWHPTAAGCFVTCAADSSVRTWSADCKQTAVLLVRSRAERRPRLTCVRHQADGKTLLIGSASGCLWLASGPAFRTLKELPFAGGRQAAEISCVAAAPDGGFAVCRVDGAVCVWEAGSAGAGRALEEAGRHCCYADGLLLVYGDSICVYRQADCIQRLPLQEPACSACWNAKSRQLFVGCSRGAMLAFYEQAADGAEEAQRPIGIKYALLKKTKKAADCFISGHAEELQEGGAGRIYTPYALPLFDDSLDAGDRARIRRADAKTSRRPELPMSGQGHGGRIGVSSTQKILTRGMQRPEADSREVLLGYAEAAAADPCWSTPAYRHSQPETLFAGQEAAKKKRKGRQDD